MSAGRREHRDAAADDDAVARQAGAQSGDGPVAAASAVAVAATNYVRRLVELAAAELELAAVSGVSMVVMVLAAAAFALVAWALLAGVVAYALVAVGLPWPVAGLLLAGAHGVAAFILWRRAVIMSRALTLPALRRVLLAADE